MRDIKISKSEDFALRIVNLSRYLQDNKKERIISSQILRSGTSIGANIAESLGSESREDYIHKLRISQKEAYETKYWLKLLYRAEYIDKLAYESLLKDCLELIRILTSIILKLQKQG